MIPEIHILTPPKWKDGSVKLLSELLHKKGIKASTPPPGTLPAKTSNFNLFVHLGDNKSFVHCEDKFNRFNIHIGFDQTNAWIYVTGSLISTSGNTKDFVAAYNELVSSDPLKGILKHIENDDLNWYWKNIAEKALLWLSTDTLLIPVYALFPLDEEERQLTYLQRLKRELKFVFTDRHNVPTELLYNYAVLLFIRDYLGPYLDGVGIKVEKNVQERDSDERNNGALLLGDRIAERDSASE